jgi:hypothetical protein
MGALGQIVKSAAKSTHFRLRGPSKGMGILKGDDFNWPRSAKQRSTGFSKEDVESALGEDYDFNWPRAAKPRSTGIPKEDIEGSFGEDYSFDWPGRAGGKRKGFTRRGLREAFTGPDSGLIPPESKTPETIFARIQEAQKRLDATPTSAFYKERSSSIQEARKRVDAMPASELYQVEPGQFYKKRLDSVQEARRRLAATPDSEFYKEVPFSPLSPSPPVKKPGFFSRVVAEGKAAGSLGYSVGEMFGGAALLGTGIATAAITGNKIISPILEQRKEEQRNAQLEASYNAMPEQYEAMQEMQMTANPGRGVGQRESMQNFMGSTAGLTLGLHKGRHGR